MSLKFDMTFIHNLISGSQPRFSIVRDLDISVLRFQLLVLLIFIQVFLDNVSAIDGNIQVWGYYL